MEQAKQEPSLERQVIRMVMDGVAEAVKGRINQNYANTPLNQTIDAVVAARIPTINALVSSAMDAALSDGGFRDALNDAVKHKLATVLVGKFGGEIEKRVNDLRASPETRAKITLALTKAIDSVTGAA